MEIKQSLWTLLNDDIRIEIPIIQRDYAQGRSDSKTEKIRKKFIKALISTLDSDNRKLELDFVYGSIENRIFKPLDGQQRLTTLFLLHWYLIYRLDLGEETKGILLKFSYETRISSREFIKSLIQNSKDLGFGENIGEKIKDSMWFYSNWSMDPTISGAINTLKTIEQALSKVNNIDRIWQRLTSLEEFAISFNFRKLENFGLSDDLYIKMNARGKELTDFEYFKAQFEKLVYSNNWEKGKEFHNTFSYKMDTKWTDFFWEFRGDDNQVDNEIINFLATLAMMNYSLNEEIRVSDEDKNNIINNFTSRKNKKELTEHEIKLRKIDDRIAELANTSFAVEIDDFKTFESFTYLNEIFDIYSKCNLMNLDLKDSEFFDLFEEKNIFENIIKDEGVTYKQRVIFFAQTCYLKKNEIINKDSLSNWMRFIRNICLNSIIDSALTFRAAIKFIDELSNGSENIYDYILKSKIHSNFSKGQMDQEIKKAKLICNSNVWKDEIFELEDTEFCKGDINFALDVANINESYHLEKFIKAKENILKHFSNEKIHNDIRRAFLTIDDCKYYNYWSHWSYNLNVAKKALLLNRTELKNNFTYGKNSKYLKGFLKEIENIELKTYLENYQKPEDMPNWKFRLIKEKELIDNECMGYYLGINKNEDTCYLFRGYKRPNNLEDCCIIK